MKSSDVLVHSCWKLRFQEQHLDNEESFVRLFLIIKFYFFYLCIMIRTHQSKRKISSFQYINERINDASNSENGPSCLNYLKWLFTVPVSVRRNWKKPVPVRFRFQKDGSRSVPVPRNREKSVPVRFRFGFRFHFFWNRRTLAMTGQTIFGKSS
jgi:hypothetical protein